MYRQEYDTWKETCCVNFWTHFHTSRIVYCRLSMYNLAMELHISRALYRCRVNMKRSMKSSEDASSCDRHDTR